MMQRSRLWAKAAGLLLIGAVGLVAACSSGDSDNNTATSTPAETSATRVDVAMSEWSISTSPISADAGEVRFYAKNDGTQLHELVVVKADADPAALPTYVAGDTLAEGHAVGDVDEDKIASEGEIEDVDPGATKDATFVLAPGNYVLLCNLPGHYAQGMHVAFTVN